MDDQNTRSLRSRWAHASDRYATGVQAVTATDGNENRNNQLTRVWQAFRIGPTRSCALSQKQSETKRSVVGPPPSAFPLPREEARICREDDRLVSVRRTAG